MAFTAYTLTRISTPANTNIPQLTTAAAALALACLIVEIYLHGHIIIIISSSSKKLLSQPYVVECTAPPECS